MSDILDDPRFRGAYEQLDLVKLNPRRHSLPTAKAHSDAAAALASRLGKANGCSDLELRLLVDLGHAHDVGKVTGSARPEHSLSVLRDCRAADPALLALVKWHDVSLSWSLAAQRGQAPTDKAWRKLAREVDLRLLCIFMVADRVDAPGGWRRNAPTTWFHGEARSRGLIGDLELDVPDHPSMVSAGGALIRAGAVGDELLLIRVRAEGFELPKGGIEWDETPQEAAGREACEEAGLRGALSVARHLGDLDYFVEAGGRRVLKRVRYYVLKAADQIEMVAKPQRTRERTWIERKQVGSIPLAHQELRPLLGAALDSEE